MEWFFLGYLGGLQGGLQGHYHMPWLELLFRLLAFPPDPYFWVNTFHSLVFFSDVLTRSWEVDCRSVAMVTSLLLRRVPTLQEIDVVCVLIYLSKMQ